MTSRERVRAVIDGKIPDRVPIDIGATTLTGIHVDAYLQLADYLGLDCAYPKLIDQFQMLARVEGPIRNWLHNDILSVENISISWGYKNTNWKPWTTQAGNPVLVPGDFDAKTLPDGKIQLFSTAGKLVGQMPKGGLYFDRVHSGTIDIMADIEMMDTKKFYESIPLYSDEELRILEKRAKLYYESTDYSIHGEFLKANLGTSGLFGIHPFEQWMCVVLLEPEYAAEMVKTYTDKALENLKMYLQAVGKYIDTIFVSSTDFGTQNGTFYSPEVFQDIYAGQYKRVNDYIHANSNIKTMFHCCGAIHSIIPHFINAGVDILNPVQTSCDGMDPQRLKDDFGSQIVFWGGGVDTQNTFPCGTKEDVANEIKERIKIFGKNGGFVFSPVHNTQYGVPPQNIEAAVQTVMEYGKY